jgi:hypothetical protein
MSDHWIRGVYLITSVTSDDPDKVLTLTSRSTIMGLIDQLGTDLTLTFHGQKLKLTNEGSLNHLPADGDLIQGLLSVPLPATVVLRVTTPITCADDHIVAVNIARCVPNPIVPRKFEQIYRSACQRMPSVAAVNVKHHIGGPVEELEITTCIVTGGAKGWTLVEDLKKALFLAASRSQKKFPEQGEITSGQKVTLTGLIARPELNGRQGMALRFLPSPGPHRWEVQLATGEGIKVKPVNLIGATIEGGLDLGSAARVIVFWGDARWSRAQLLGETARGHWGVCKATVGEFILPPEDVWRATLVPGRLAYAPISAMTDETLLREMETAYHTATGARSATQNETEVEEDERVEMEQFVRGD